MTSQHRFRLLLVSQLAALVGCVEKTPEPPSYNANLVYEQVVEVMADQSLDGIPEDVDTILVDTFGTPLDRKVPEDLADLIDHSQLAAGAAVYEKNCLACHGVNGDGRGPAAALLTPYPRDYRPGTFKFKSSLPGEKPLVEDIANIVKTGVPGTGMKALPELSDDERLAVAHYVVYLSARGNLERSLLMTAGFDFDLESGERLIPPTPLPEEYEGMDAEESEELVVDLTLEIADSWLDSESFLDSVEVPDFLNEDGSSDDLVAAVERGKEHFASKAAACASCHREDANGNVIPADKPLYDVWTEEWTTRIGLDPKDEYHLVPLIARGALPPREAIPRRLGHEPLRGGDDPRAIYAKIKYGIDGTPMPRASIGDDVVWDLVAYILDKQTQWSESQSEMADAEAADDENVAIASAD